MSQIVFRVPEYTIELLFMKGRVWRSNRLGYASLYNRLQMPKRTPVAANRGVTGDRHERDWRTSIRGGCTNNAKVDFLFW